jgi:hypothetical protein
MSTPIGKHLPAVVRTALVALANLQGVLGMVMLSTAVGTLWRPAGGFLVAGGLLVLTEFIAMLTARGRAA